MGKDYSPLGTPKSDWYESTLDHGIACLGPLETPDLLTLLRLLFNLSGDFR